MMIGIMFRDGVGWGSRKGRKVWAHQPSLKLWRAMKVLFYGLSSATATENSYGGGCIAWFWVFGA